MVTHLIVVWVCAVLVGAYLERIVDRTRNDAPVGLANLVIFTVALAVGAFEAAAVVRALS